MHINSKIEKTPKAWALRALFGPALIVDGVVALFTFSTISLGLSLKCARALAKSRLESTRTPV